VNNTGTKQGSIMK